MIYADNAATTQMGEAAINAMTACMRDTWGNPSSLYGLGQRAKEALEDARERIATCIGASPKEITFTSGGSEADNQAIRSAALLGARRGKRHIISTAFEHHAVLHTLKRLEDEGFEMELLPVGPLGTVTAHQVAEAIREDTALVTIMYANNEIGSILPVSEIGAVCRERRVIFHTDAVQAAGHLPIDVRAQNIDLLSLSAHKFHGPKGIGVLYARQGVPLTSLIEGGAQERGKRAGTENVSAFAGMDAPPFQSGTFDSKSRRISKRGSPHLRKTLFMVASTILQHSDPANPIFQFMDKKRAEGKHFYVYTVAGAAKFLRIYYARVKTHLMALDAGTSTAA